jgi:hypothetical protein
MAVLLLVGATALVGQSVLFFGVFDRASWGDLTT